MAKTYTKGKKKSHKRFYGSKRRNNRKLRSAVKFALLNNQPIPEIEEILEIAPIEEGE